MRQLFTSAFGIKADCQDFSAVNEPEALKRALFTFDLDTINITTPIDLELRIASHCISRNLASIFCEPTECRKRIELATLAGAGHEK